MYRGAQYGGYVQSSKGSRTDPPTKSNIAVSHEAAAKGDIVQLVSTPTYQPNGFHRSCPQAHTVACSYSVVQVMESLAGTDERFWTFLVCDRSCLPSGSFTSLSISLSLSLQRRMLTAQEIDPITFDEHNCTLAHKAAMNGHVVVLSYLLKDGGMPINALQIPDENFTTPAMLAIQVYSVCSTIRDNI